MSVCTRKDRRIPWRAAAFAVACLCALCACGQKGALYLPDHAPQPVIAPAALPDVVPPASTSPSSADGASTTGTSRTDAPKTRKAPPEPDPATAR